MNPTDQDHIRWMKLALALGERNLGQCWPNPAVGCVIVRDNHIIARGWTQKTGRPHAETIALERAGNKARGATAYVTLEPCAHTGQTPPCAKALIDAGIAHVVIATQDPDERVSGKGIQMLLAAGIKVTSGVLQAQADYSHAGFFTRIGQNRPLITLKLAISLDGKIATRTGHSQWITGAKSRHYAHYLRLTHDGVLIGKNTMLKDNPSLLVRGYGDDSTQPIRIILDSNLHTQPAGQLAHSATIYPVWICHGNTADPARWQAQGAKTIACHKKADRIDILDCMAQLADAGLTRILCEGGSNLAATLLDAGLVDRLVLMNAGIVIGCEGVSAVGALGLDRLDFARRFSLRHREQLGMDILSIWDIKH